jgi:hypothetical protein
MAVAICAVWVGALFLCGAEWKPDIKQAVIAPAAGTFWNGPVKLRDRPLNTRIDTRNGAEKGRQPQQSARAAGGWE